MKNYIRQDEESHGAYIGCFILFVMVLNTICVFKFQKLLFWHGGKTTN